MTDLMRSNYRSMLPLRDAFDRLFEGAFTPVYGEGAASSAAIPTNIWETGEGYQVALLVPGVNPESVEITTLENTLTISGETRPMNPEGSKALFQEMGYGRFQRHVTLPMVLNADQVVATFEHGLLKLTLPKAPEHRERKIQIQTAAAK